MISYLAGSVMHELLVKSKVKIQECINILFVSRTNTATGMKMVMARGPLLCSKIPQEMRNTGSLSVLKHRLKN